MTSGTTEELFDIWGRSPVDIYAVGAAGTILHYNGFAWSAMDSGVTRTLKKVTGKKYPIAIGADGFVLRYDGASWSPLNLPKPSQAYADIWGLDILNLFAVGDGGAIENFQTIQWIPMVSNTTSDLARVWGPTEEDVFAVGRSGEIVFYDGNPGRTWAPMQSGTAADLHSVHGNSDRYVFAVGAGGGILHFNGSAWSAMTSGTTADLADVWSTYGLDAYAVGAGGNILHFSGSAWSAMTSGTASDLNRVWGLSISEIFVVGDNGTILHYLNTSTTTIPPGGSTSTTAPAVTTAPSSTTSTTTSAAPAWQCPFRRSPVSGAQLQSLRALRDRKVHTAIGAMLVTMYYKHMQETASILSSSAALNSRFRLLTIRHMPAIRSLLRRGSAAISGTELIAIHQFLTDLQAQAGPELSMDIDFILKGFESGWLLRWLGITIDD